MKLPLPRTTTAALLGLCWVCSCRPPAPAAGGPGAGAPPAFPVVAVAARVQPITESVALVGTLAANEEVEVRAETDGVVRAIPFNEGQTVQADDLLLQLDDTKFAAELAEAEAKLKLYEANFARARQLLEEHLISQQEYDQAASAFEAGKATSALKQRQLEDSQVRAPFPGTCGPRRISPGQNITRNTVITWLVDLDPVKVEMYVPERFLGQIRLGQVVRFRVAAYPTNQFEGDIYFIDSRLDLDTRAALVKARIPNPDGILRAGMVANLALTLTLRENALVIPEAAILSNGDMNFVYGLDPNLTVVLRPVRLGERLPRWVEILEGLAPGDRVVAEGHQKIGPGMTVALAPPGDSSVYEESALQR